MNERPLSRAQNVLRSFFGLGPQQFSSLDTIFPSINVEGLMRTPQDCVVVTVQSAAIGAASDGGMSVGPPSPGPWLLHAWSINSDGGPGTSGSWRFTPYVQLQAGLWGIGAIIGLNETAAVPITKMGAVNIVCGKWLDVPIQLHRSRSGISDLIGWGLRNETGSVGNVTFTGYALLRPLEPVLNQ